MPAENLAIFIVLFVVLVAGSALFSGIETALFSLQDYQVRRLRERNLPLAQALEKLRANPRRLLSLHPACRCAGEYPTHAARLLFAAGARAGHSLCPQGTRHLHAGGRSL
ncbi:MAG: DUF21 domain-containing protein [Chthoniobacteraceae bacterium]